MKRFVTSILTALCVGATVGALATDSVAASASQLMYERETLQNPPACALTLEEAKVKNMTAWEYCRVDGEYDAWYFMGDGSASGNPEIRFIADGVQTVTKPYTLVPMEVGSFSFEYCIVNDDPKDVADLAGHDYIVQILGADGAYPIIPVNISAYGDWNTIMVDETTKFYATLDGAETYGQYKNNFCGFLFKMGGLDGEFMIRNIVLYDFDGNEIVPETDTPEEGGDVSSEESISSEETVSSEKNSFSEDDYDSEKDNVGTFESDSNGSLAGQGTSIPKKGCGSFGVGATALGALAAAGVVLGVHKKKRK